MGLKFNFLAIEEGACPPGPLPAPGAWLGYRIREGRLLRGPLPRQAAGGLLGVREIRGPVKDARRVLEQLLAECRRRNYSGIFWDLAPTDAHREALSRLCPALRQRGVFQLAPLALAPQAGEARLLIPSSVSGGSCRDMLRDCGERLGPARCFLEVCRLCNDFPMPAGDSDGVRLRDRDLRQLLEKPEVHDYFSPELCCRCFLYSSPAGPHFVLYGDPDSARQAIALAREAGFPGLLLRRQAWGDRAADILAE